MKSISKGAMIALLSSLIVIAGGAPLVSSAQGLPAGSYGSTCHDAEMVDGVLAAVCQRTDGSWKNAALPHPELCTNGVVNSNGSLICSASSSLPSPGPTPTRLAAILRGRGDQVVFIFRNGSLAAFNMAANRMLDGYPKALDDPGMGPYARMISSAFHDDINNKFYFFLTNGAYIRFDPNANQVDPGYPGPVDERSWPGLSAYASRIACVLNWPGDKVQFILNDGTYVRYDSVADRADPGYPGPIDERSWPGVAPYAGEIESCFSANNGKAYFFLRDGRYLRYDIAADRLDPGYPARSTRGAGRGSRPTYGDGSWRMRPRSPRQGTVPQSGSSCPLSLCNSRDARGRRS